MDSLETEFLGRDQIIIRTVLVLPLLSPGGVDSPDLLLGSPVQRDVVLLSVEVHLVVGHLGLHEKFGLLVWGVPSQLERVTVIVHTDITGSQSQRLTTPGHAIELRGD